MYMHFAACMQWILSYLKLCVNFRLIIITGDTIVERPPRIREDPGSITGGSKCNIMDLH